jgi:Ca2+-binding EF-hand superfamily protein
MLSELRTRKFSRLFTCFDFNRDGALEKADYEQFAQNLSKAYALVPGTAQYATMHVETMGLWNFIQSVADKDGNQEVTPDEFIAAYAELTNHEETFQQLLMAYAEYIIRMGDRDGDGKLDENEYTTILWCYGIGDEAARAAFRHLVTDGSGYLTTAAMEKVFAEFFCSDDPDAPGNWMIGPL